MTNKIHPNLPIDGNKSIPNSSSKYLVDLQDYINSKRCYSSEPLNQAEIQSIEPRVAYQCKIKILLEQREVSWSEKPTKQRLDRSSKPIFDLWNDYQFQLPNISEKKFEQKRALIEHDFTTNCEVCQGQRTIKCHNQRCTNGNEICLSCTQGLRSDGSSCPQCKNGSIPCELCRGKGQLDCLPCTSFGAFHHSAVLHVWWELRTSIWYYQNSFLPEEIIDQAHKISLWSKSETPWTQDSSIEDFLQSLNESQSNVPLKTNIIKDYREKYLHEAMKMRRLICDIERLDFEEIEYALGPKYLNKQNPTRGKYFSSTFHLHHYSLISLNRKSISILSILRCSRTAFHLRE